MVDSKYIESRSFEGPLYLTAIRILRLPEVEMEISFGELWKPRLV